MTVNRSLNPSIARPAIARRKATLPILLMAAAALTLLPTQSGATMSADQIVDAMIRAHGGMERWTSAPTVSFQDAFKFGGSDQAGISHVTVEQGPRRAYMDIPGTEISMAWDGEKAWSQNWQGPFPPRFLALLNYHFLNLPWLAKDPGVHLGQPGTAKLWDDPTEYVTIKVTYGEGVGDTPEDYYVLYIHPETHRLVANEYIVTYRSILPEGVEATTPHILVYDEFATIDGLSVPTAYTIYEPDKSVYASCDVSDWSFKAPFDTARMTMPPGAVVDESKP